VVLKADSTSASDFEAAESRQWVYEGHKGRKPTAMPYWSIPDSAIDDPDEMAVWAKKAYEAALRSGK
jgi:DNA transformation protein and related proteins